MAQEHPHAHRLPGASTPLQPSAAHASPLRATEARALRLSLALLVAFMAAEVATAIVASSIALLADAAHMLTDAAALALALLAARLARRPARGSMTFGLGRAEILSAHANGMTLLVLALIILYGAIRHLIAPPNVQGVPVLAVALAGIAVNLIVTRLLSGDARQAPDSSDARQTPDSSDARQIPDSSDARQTPEQGVESTASTHPTRSLNVEGSYQHILTDLLGFIVTALAALAIIASGFDRADGIASVVIAAIMLHAAYKLLKASMRVMMEAAPTGLDPEEIGRRLASQTGVVEVHDLHIWEVTSGFLAVSAHIVVDVGHDCHDLRRTLASVLTSEFGLTHSTLQVEHALPAQPPLQIEISASPAGESRPEQ